jgi:hypothetical protein
MTVRNIEVEGYYKGNYETTMTTATIDNLALTPSGYSKFPITMKTPALKAEQYKTVLKYLQDDCGADPIAAKTKKWPLDLKIKVNFMGIKFDFWIRNIQIPVSYEYVCVRAGGVLRRRGVDKGVVVGRARALWRGRM